jgi:TatD DNase family protein
MRLVDSHAHLQADAFADDGREVIRAARAAGVERLLVPGWDVGSSQAAVALAATIRVDAAVGIHPHVASGADDEAWAEIVRLADRPEVVAIGETGLDYDRAFSPRVAQLVSLRRHLLLGRALHRPVILHCRSAPGARDAHDDVLAELAAAGAGTREWPAIDGRPPALLHSYSGPVDYAERALAMGLAISFSGLVFRAGEGPSAEVARLVPAERLLVETDSPYLSPPGAPKRRNEPLWVAVTQRWLAEQRREDTAALGEQLVRNYDRIFGG